MPEGGGVVVETMPVALGVVLMAMLGRLGGANPTRSRVVATSRARSSSLSPLGTNISLRRASDGRGPRLPFSMGDSLLQSDPGASAAPVLRWSRWAVPDRPARAGDDPRPARHTRPGPRAPNNVSNFGQSATLAPPKGAPASHKRRGVPPISIQPA